MTIAITASGIALDGPLVAGEKVAVSVSGLTLAAEDKPTLALLARFPDALLASVELAEDADAQGTWTGELDTATKQTALFFATARADERRDAALELVSGRASLARLTVPMANSALCPKPDGSPFASPVYVPVPGPPGTGGDPYDQNPEMDGEASAGTSDEYARGDHVHPTDTTRQAVIADLATIRSGAASGATAVQPSDLSAYRTASAQDAIDGAQDSAIAAKYTKPSSGIPASDIAAGVIPTVPSLPLTVANGGTGATTAADARVNLGAMAASADGNTILTGGTDWDGSPIGVFADQTTRKMDTKADSVSIAAAFSTSSTYAVGDYCTYEGLLYKCTTAVSTAGAWDSTNWTAVASTGELNAVKATIPTVDSALSPSSTNPVQNKAINTALGGYVPWADATNKTIKANSARASITVGFNTDATGGGTASFGHLTKALAYGSFVCGYNARASSTNTHSYAFVWNGDGYHAVIYDSHGLGTFNVNPVPASGSTDPATGFWIGETKLSDYFCYAFASPTPTVSGTAATVACEDRSINDFTVATGVTSLTITPPAAVTGRARDFFCRITLTDASLPTVTLSGATIDIGSSEIAGMAQGVNLLMFTEIASGHWLASRRSAS